MTSRATGVSEGTISCYKKGKYQAKQNRVYDFARALRVDPAWLMGYDVPMEPQGQSAPAKPIIPPGFLPMPEMTTVPIVGRIACGTPILAEQNIEGSACMPARWRAKQPEVENGEIAAVRIGEEATLKRVYRHENMLELRPENPTFESIILVGEDMGKATIEGKAVGLCRDI